MSTSFFLSFFHNDVSTSIISPSSDELAQAFLLRYENETNLSALAAIHLKSQTDRTKYTFLGVASLCRFFFSWVGGVCMYTYVCVCVREHAHARVRVFLLLHIAKYFLFFFFFCKKNIFCRFNELPEPREKLPNIHIF